jgi:guanine deaminase
LQAESLHMQEHYLYLEMAVSEAAEGMRAGDGGPFGAVVVMDGKVIGRAHNTVLRTHDPTAHAEINAIREACSRTGKYHLTGAVIYSNFEPCPMCLSAIYWADIRDLFFSAGRDRAAAAGFMDRQLYREVALPLESREIRTTCMEVEQMEQLIRDWDRKEDKILY